MQLVELAVSWWRAITSVILGVIGQLMFRRFGLAQTDDEWPFGITQSVSGEIFPQGIGWLLAGGIAYLFAVLLWVRVLQQLSLARAYPLLSLGYPLVYAGAVVWLGEEVTIMRTLGTGLVCLGVLFAVAPASASAGAASSSNTHNG